MKNQLIIFVAAMTVMSFQANAQQALNGGTEIVSPEIHEDHTVTFKVQAPGAEEVKLTGDWMPAEGWVPCSVTMVRDQNGLWAYTTAVLEPELYGYAFLIDGVRTNDPNNVFVSRDIATNTNTFDYVGLFSAALLPNHNTSEVYKNIDATLKTQMENGYELYWIGIGKAAF